MSYVTDDGKVVLSLAEQRALVRRLCDTALGVTRMTPAQIGSARTLLEKSYGQLLAKKAVK